jgi:hypothetical protein
VPLHFDRRTSLVYDGALRGRFVTLICRLTGRAVNKSPVAFLRCAAQLRRYMAHQWHAWRGLVMSAALIAGCGFVHDETIAGPYRLIAVDVDEHMTIQYDSGDGNGCRSRPEILRRHSRPGREGIAQSYASVMVSINRQIS